MMKPKLAIQILSLLMLSWSLANAEPYEGHARNAAWRSVASERINAHRKGDLEIRVVDANGSPIEKAEIAIEQASHAFPFGVAVNSRLLMQQTIEAATYRKRIVDLFNTATIENGLKWHRWEAGRVAGYRKSQTIGAIDWLRLNGLQVRGHVLVWPSEKYMPKDIIAKTKAWRPIEEDRQYVRNRIAKHIDSIGEATAGKLNVWDVVNEPRKNHVLMDYLPEGNSAMADWFRQANKAAPDAKLFLNEYGILDGGKFGTADQELLASHLQGLLDAKSPLDGVGLQAHFWNEQAITAPEMLWRILDKYAALVPEIQITEFDFNTQEEQLQADYMRDFMIATFAHPRVTGITHWGLWEGSHWRPEAAFYRKDWSIKPNGKAYLDLVYRDWWSDEKLTSDKSGAANVRVFHGDYRIVVSYNDQRVETELTVGKEGASTTVSMP